MRTHQYLLKAIAVATALLLMLPLLAERTTGPELEVFFIPQEDLARAPGYSEQGVYLPLSELCALAEKAHQAALAPPESLEAYCTSVHLQGTLDDVLSLRGSLEFVARSEDWTAVLIDDGSMPWSSQSVPEGTKAFLSRLNGKTYLFAKGPARGAISLRALVPVRFINSRTTLSFGRFFAPCRIDVETGEGIAVESARVPMETEKLATGSRLSLFPTQKRKAELTLKRTIPFTVPSSLRIELNRTIAAIGAGLNVTDQLILQDIFPADKPVVLELPEGLRPLRAETQDPVAAEVAGETLTLTPQEEREVIHVGIVFVADLAEGQASVGGWKITGLTRRSRLSLRGSDKYLPLPSPLPPALIPTGGSPEERHYDYWGALPPMTIALVPRTQRLPPRVHVQLAISRNEATARYQVQIADQQREMLQFTIPAEWMLTELKALRDNRTVPFALQLRNGAECQVNWRAGDPPETIACTLHRVGAWGAPRTTTSLGLPLVGFEGPRPSSYELSVSCPEDIKVRATQLSQLKIVPGVEAAAAPAESAPALVLRAAGASPEGELTVEGRDADVRATVVTALSIGEDRTTIRALLRYEVRIAPTSTFQFVLPGGIGTGVRIDGPGIRETSLRTTQEGDEWTVVTQHEVRGIFELTLEWSLEATEGEQAIAAPEIYVKKVTSQEGFLVLEGSETLRLTVITQNLAETDLAELPAVPWRSDKRVIAVYRYVQPPFLLRVETEKAIAEPPLEGLVQEAKLTTSIAPYGQRFTEAVYTVMPIADRQFFEAQLPRGAELWGVLVNGQGAEPARRKTPQGEDVLMVSLPALSGGASAIEVTIVYQEQGESLFETSELVLNGPTFSIPVNRTIWHLNLPPGFEYLSYGGGLRTAAAVREPLLRFLRTAYYPPRLVLLGVPTGWIVFFTILGLLIFVASGKAAERRRRRREKTAEIEKKPRKPRKWGTRLLELLIVLAIVAILAAISVPNFLEAQVRSKVSRVKADQRSLATALEAYYIDNNAYPKGTDILWQGPVKYITSGFEDPHSETHAYFKYVEGVDAFSRAAQAGLVGADQQPTQEFWLLYSIGPDGVDDGGRLLYDPTNGTISAGDVVRVSRAAPTTFAPRYRGVREEEEKRAVEGVAGIPIRGVPPVTPVPEQPPARPPAEPPAAPASEAAGIPEAARPPQEEISDFEAGFFAFIPPRRYEGLQSLDIEIPAGGVQRKFEAIGYESLLTLRLLAEEEFLRLRFITWMGMLLLMVVIWAVSRRLYKVVFVALIGLTLLLPVLKTTPWVVFYNTAFQGVLFSLVAPLVSSLLRRYLQWPMVQGVASALLVLCLFTPAVGSAESASPAVEAEAVSIIVPYAPEKPPLAEQDPLAFINRAQFTRLWKAAHPETPWPTRITPLLTQISLEANLLPEKSSVEGKLTITAVNPNDIPATISLGMKTLQCEAVSSADGRASLESTPEGLILQLEAHCISEIVAQFSLPCRVQGSTGRMQLHFPETATGLWRIGFPYRELTAQTRDNKPFISEKTQQGDVLLGPIRPGLLELSWTVKKARGEGPVAEEQRRWRAEIESRFTWDTLAAAQWLATLKVQATEVGGVLPSEIRISRPPQLFLVSAEGDKLLGTSVVGEELVFQLQESAEAVIWLTGFLHPPETSVEGEEQLKPHTWNLVGLRAPQGVESQATISFEISDQIEILSFETEQLVRAATRGARSGFTVQRYEATAPEWQAQVELKRLAAEFDAELVEVLAAEEGFLHRVVSSTLSPRGSVLQECSFTLPRGLQVKKVQGNNITHWAQHQTTLFLAFQPPLEQPATFELIGVSDRDIEASLLEVSPVSVNNASEARHSLVLLVPPDEELREVELAGATPRAPTRRDQQLIALLPLSMSQDLYSLRAYVRVPSQPLRFQLSPVEATALLTIYNQVTISDGLQSLNSVVRAVPRRGRLQTIEVLLLLGTPDPLASSRLQALGPVRDLRTEEVSERVLKVIAELNAPYSRAVDVRFLLDQPVGTAGGDEVGVSVFVPREGEGARSLLLLRRAFEGELTVSQSAGGRVIDPEELRYPELGFIPLPSDQTFELSLQARTGPSFLITRHEREEGLRAVVEVLRQRTIITPDEMERNELEIVLQNQSEQFLKIALPYPKSQISVYEVQVASRVVKTTFGKEEGREVLLVPLIRTGLLEPELTVRVAYTVEGREPLRGSGEREQHLPEILGGVPVSQSALVLMLPATFKYSDFDGSLNQVELVDIEVGEALRRARRIEKYSEQVLYSTADKQQIALDNLGRLGDEVSATLKSVEKTAQAYKRVQREIMPGKKVQVERQERLAGERASALEQAQVSASNIMSNVAQVRELVEAQEMVQQLPQPQVMPERRIAPAPAPPVPVIQFPRSGDVFVFRQLQGTGFIGFNFVSREASGKRKDLIFFAIVMVLAAVFIYHSQRLFASRRAVALLLFVGSLIAIIAGFALDVTIPVLIISAALIHGSIKRS